QVDRITGTFLSHRRERGTRTRSSFVPFRLSTHLSQTKPEVQQHTARGGGENSRPSDSTHASLTHATSQEQSQQPRKDEGRGAGWGIPQDRGSSAGRLGGGVRVCAAGRS
ncbi:unnamed protein product, partial [Ectocarpus sp. 8 AP-2014]